MNYLKSFKTLISGESDPTLKISEILPISEKSFSCNANECDNKFKESCFSLKEIDKNVPLYETSEPCDLHFLVSTGKTDWIHDAFDESNTILNLVTKESNKIGDKFKIKIKNNVTNEAVNIMDSDCLQLKKLDMLLLPWFVWIYGITANNIENFFKIIEDVITESNNNPNLKGNEGKLLLSKCETEIPEIKVKLDVNKSYILLCSHKTRDKKCGITAPFMKKEFDSQLRDLELYRDTGDDRSDGVKVLFVNHVGGHKFAANVLVYNKHGEFVWFARCTPLNVKFILNETILNHKVYPKNIRACSKFDSIKW